MKTRDSYKIVVIGAGTAGISSTAHLLRNVPLLKESIAIIDHQKTLLSTTMEFSRGGIVSKESTIRDQELLIPKGQHGSLKVLLSCFRMKISYF